jgi:hypothetical protein
LPELLAALDAFLQEHRRCGDLDGGADGDVICDPPRRYAHASRQREGLTRADRDLY